MIVDSNRCLPRFVFSPFFSVSRLYTGAAKPPAVCMQAEFCKNKPPAWVFAVRVDFNLL